MYKKFDVLFSEAFRSHYIVIWADFNLRTYNLQEFNPIKGLFGSVATYSHQELEDNHFHINGESRIRRRIKEIVKNLDIEDFTHDGPGDDGTSTPYYDEEKTEKLLLEAHGLRPFRKSFDDNPAVKQLHTGEILGTMEPGFDGKGNLTEISIIPILGAGSPRIGDGLKPSIVMIDDPEPKPVKTIKKWIDYLIWPTRK